MKYLLFICFSVCFLKSYSQADPGKLPCDTIIKHQVDSIVKAKLDSIADNKPEEEKTKKKGFLDILADKKIEIRKGFSATTKDDQQPASVFWNKDFLTQFHYTSVDIGVRNKSLRFPKKPGKAELFVLPKIEWHKNGDTTNKSKNNKNNLSGGINFEYDYTVNKWTPFATGSIDYKHDFVNKNGTLDLAAYASFFSRIKPLPGSQIRWGKNRHSDLALRYYIYTGVEYYKRTDSSSQSTTYWASKLSLEFNPIPQFMEFTFEYTYRKKTSDSFYKMGDINWLSTGVNHYFDSKRRIGLGISYSRGNDPNNSFVKTKKIDLGVKFKL